MATLTIEERIAALDDALASPELKVKYRDREVEYRSRAEMLAERARLAAELAAGTSGGYRTFAQNGRGLR